MITRVLAVLILICCMATVVAADDLFAPTWRGGPASTLQDWAFDTDANPADPTAYMNPYGKACMSIDFSEPFGTGWWEGSDWEMVYGSKRGWWDIGDGSMTVLIPNSPNLGPDTYKDIRIQITYWEDISQAPTIGISPFAEQIGSTQITLVEAGPMGGGWYSMLTDWRLVPNPSCETITINGDPMWGTMIDAVVIDTQCVVVPEPGSMLALASGVFGIAGMVIRRRS